ncbi:SAM-dependent methyltransferase [Gracilimonas mengyeensis]|uniref:16S rRNA (Cytidine1402-2'-O)-methyltransferase n=1 Tax=Gracilimonas mengyeensis TaxID=1302730 RepID=A0A521BBY8_9BACT|nr:SAM-dependent methyltransferase [Gracilimonas mengyeensis]SMO44576.1 16S rRNA (cytidine1402-2'-O)-methyltransferase [Gracilimonas mengyeensis]
MPGTLYLIPTTLGKTPENNTIPEYTLNVLRQLEVLMVENLRSATSFLQWVGDTIPEYEIEFYHLNKNTPDQEIYSFLRPLKAGKDAGILSEAGAPAVADPGAKLVKLAHQNNIKVVPLVGPSSILLALMSSGFNGQNFAFHGYLPIDQHPRKQMITQLEGESRRHDRTQIFMEAPYRNNELLKDILQTCRPETKLCTATDITLPDEEIHSKTVGDWKSGKLPNLHKRPTIFLLYGK